MNSIKNKILKSAQVEWKKFKFLQTESFKALGIAEKERLRRSIIENDFVESFKVWENGDTLFCLDGYHRCLVLKELSDNGYDVPEQFHADFIDCENEKEASKLVLVYSSIYAKVEPDGLHNFIEDHELNFNDVKDFIDIPNVDLESISNINELLKEVEIDLTKDGDEYEDVEENFEPFVGEPTAKKGDVWLLGSHRVCCGDSTSKEDMEKLLDGNKATICITSPPYNCGSLGLKDKVEKRHVKTGQKYLNNADEMTDEEYIDFLTSTMNNALDGADTVFWNVQMLAGNKNTLWEFFYYFKPFFKDFIYWYKTNPAPALKAGVMNSCVELIPAYSNDNPTRTFDRASFKQGTCYNVIKGSKHMGNEFHEVHKAAFPLYLPVCIIKDFSFRKDIVLDIFGGTGTTLMACEKLDRSAYLMEIEPTYVDIIIARWEKETGKKARLEDG